MTSSDNVCHVKFYLSQLNLAPSPGQFLNFSLILSFQGNAANTLKRGNLNFLPDHTRLKRQTPIRKNRRLALEFLTRIIAADPL